ncbi:hypothetical protein HPP92_013758 [Vanilla planifolia]|uniref:Uncharacterized protein n=1 Tax=Vanilla planifolia TaxID=51239 RepID=A0A835UWS9_VANPL|nr:hypothetical protein HPP92_013758 [Vanilla planifolia]
MVKTMRKQLVTNEPSPLWKGKVAHAKKPEIGTIVFSDHLEEESPRRSASISSRLGGGWHLDVKGPPRFEGDRPRFGDRDGYRGGHEVVTLRGTRRCSSRVPAILQGFQWQTCLWPWRRWIRSGCIVFLDTGSFQLKLGISFSVLT